MRIQVMVGALAAALALSSQALAQDTLRFAIFTPEVELATARILIPWAERVTEESNGALEIQVFADGALGRNPALQTRLLHDGIADIVWAVPSYTPGVYPDDEVFELPNVIQNSTEGSVAAWRMLEAGMLRGYEDYYMIGLFTSPPAMLHTNFPVREIGDLAGHKLRVVGSLLTAAVTAVGAVPEGMPITQVVEAISRGVIDGSTGHPIFIDDFGVSRVTNSHFLGRIGSNTVGIFMTRERFEQLSPESQAVLERNRGEALSIAFGSMNDERNAELLAEWRADPNRIVTDLTPEQAEQWNGLLAPVVAGWVGQSARNQELLDALNAALDAVRAGN